MKYGPNINRIGGIVTAWQKGVMTLDEATERLELAMDPENALPELEQYSQMPVDVGQRTADLFLRIEHKLNLIIRGQNISLPDELNPQIMGEKVKKLVDQHRKVEAIQLHREQTGAGLSEAQEVIQKYLKQPPKPNG